MPEGPFQWYDSEISIEVKGSEAGDCFNDDGGDPQDESNDPRAVHKESIDADKIRGQLADYIKEQAERQHRTHIFQILIFGNFARFLYWDRSGFAFSKKFDYVAHPRILAEFFWRYGHLTAAQRGWDTSVTLADPDEVQDFEKNVPTLVKDKVGERPNLPNYKVTWCDESYPTYKTVVHFVKENRDATLITKRAFFGTTSPCGRATRGYLAYEAKEHEVYFLKDAWRTAYEGHESEAEAYVKLEKLKVPHIPTILSAADVCSSDGKLQRTLIADLAESSHCSWNRTANVSTRPLLVGAIGAGPL